MKLSPWLAVLCFTASVFAGPEERVTEIRGWYETIQKAKPSKERKIPFGAEDEPDNGELVVRDYADGWKAIALTVNAEHGGADERFYYKEGVLFFAHVSTTHWKFFGGEKDDGTSVVTDTRKEDRYYYEGENCVRQLTRSATTTSGEKDPAAELAKAEQKSVEPDWESKKLRRRAMVLLDATTGEAVMRALELE